MPRWIWIVLAAACSSAVHPAAPPRGADRQRLRVHGAIASMLDDRPACAAAFEQAAALDPRAPDDFYEAAACRARAGAADAAFRDLDLAVTVADLQRRIDARNALHAAQR